MSLDDVEMVDADAEAGTKAPQAGQGAPKDGGAAVEAGKGSGTLAEGAGDADKPVATPATFPEDWREQMAGGDEALLKQLKRYATPANYAKAGYQAQQKIRSGEMKAVLPENASEAEVAAWRKENGVPDKPEEYKVEPPNGYVFGEAEKPLLDSFKAHAHAKNWTPTQLNQAVEWWTAEQEQVQARQHKADTAFKTEAEDALRKEWGPEFRANLTAIQSVLATAPQGFADRLLSGRTGDGKKIGDDPVVLGWLAQIAHELNPAASVVPAGTTNAPKAIESRKRELEAMMGDTRSSEYWKGPNAAALQAEYRQLIEVEERMGAKKAA